MDAQNVWCNRGTRMESAFETLHVPLFSGQERDTQGLYLHQSLPYICFRTRSFVRNLFPRDMHHNFCVFRVQKATTYPYFISDCLNHLVNSLAVVHIRTILCNHWTQSVYVGHKDDLRNTCNVKEN